MVFGFDNLVEIEFLTGEILDEQCSHLIMICCLVKKNPNITNIAITPKSNPAFHVGVSQDTINSSSKNKVTANARSRIENSR